MRRASLVSFFSLVLLIVMSIPLGAAELQQTEKDGPISCGPGAVGTWHFVANQVGDVDGVDIAITADGVTLAAVAMEKKGKGQGSWHYWLEEAGNTLQGATTYVNGAPADGKLVLSEYYCTPAPPPCDPKTDPNKCEPPEK